MSTRDEMQFLSKADNLAELSGCLTKAELLPQVSFFVSEWRLARVTVLDRIQKSGLFDHAAIIRSSASDEDITGNSKAGAYASIGGVEGRKAVGEAIDRVIESYGHRNASDEAQDQVFVQPFLDQIEVSGVAFGQDPNTRGFYAVINYDDESGSTKHVTNNSSQSIKTYFHHWRAEERPTGVLGNVIALLEELVVCFGTYALDIEFAVDQGQLYLLQVRRLKVTDPTGISVEEHAEAVRRISEKIVQVNKPHPDLLGKLTLFGVMPDWNPAEMIGLRPRPLALSLYCELITDSIWAYQRDNYGYKNLRSVPLMLDFYGLPYIDVRASFNSFIPKDLPPELAERLVDFYLKRLSTAPSLHDKVEFDIIFSCYTFDLSDRLSELKQAGFNKSDLATLTDSLRRLTNRIIHNETGLWKHDLERIYELDRRRETIATSSLDHLSRIYWLIEDCKRYGTLPFAGLARAAFIAVQMLSSLVAIGELEEEDTENFIQSLNTITYKMKVDYSNLTPAVFLERYGHLRPGTYDILSPRYDEAPDLYFDWNRVREIVSRPADFVLSSSQINSIEARLVEHGLDLSGLEIFEFMRASIRGREFAKFRFSRSLSDALKLFAELGAENGFSPEDCSFADIRVIHDLYLGSSDPRSLLAKSIEDGRARYKVTQTLTLPPLIERPEQAWSFHLPPTEPNYVTQKRVIGPVRTEAKRASLDNAILLIANVDPGYDWVFTHNIAGLVTIFGGVNSHMAIRAGELGIPAVIGVGETAFTQWSQAQVLEIDCANRRVVIIR